MAHRYPRRERQRNHCIGFVGDPSSDYDWTEYDCSSDSDNSQSSSDTDSISTSDVLEQPSPTQITDFPSFTDLQDLLQEQCSEEHAALPDISSLPFEDWNGSKRLRIGTLRTPFDPAHHTIYASVCGDDNNRISLTQGSANKSLPLVDAYVVELDQPFWSICWNGRLFHDEEKRRLRALLCYVFLAAGHLHGFKRYSDFEKYLVDACRWAGGAVREKMGQQSGTDENGVETVNRQQPRTELMPFNLHSSSIKSSDTDKRKRIPSYERGHGDQAEPSAKRMKLKDTLAAMRRRHSEQSADIDAVEREMTDLKDSIGLRAEVEARAIEQAKEIEKLKMQLQKWEENAKTEKEIGKKEKVLRLEAERKLKEYVDAQKKMALEFS